MAKGATKTGEQMGQGTYATAQGVQQGAGAQQGQAYDQLQGQISQMLQPGGSPAVTAATMGALGSKYGAGKQAVLDTAAHTNNGASTNAALDTMALNQGAQTAQTAAQNVSSQQDQAQKLLAQIYGQSSQNQTQALGAQNSATNAYTGAAKTGGGVLSKILGAAAGGASGAAAAAQQ